MTVEPFASQRLALAQDARRAQRAVEPPGRMFFPARCRRCARAPPRLFLPPSGRSDSACLALDGDDAVAVADDEIAGIDGTPPHEIGQLMRPATNLVGPFGFAPTE